MNKPKAHASDYPAEVPSEVIDQCEALFVSEGKTLAAVAAESGVSAAQVRRWSAQYGWKKKREQYAARLSHAKEEANALVREEILLEDLIYQKDLLKKYFDERDSLNKDDIKAMYAYTNVTDSICKILSDMRKLDDAIHGMQKIDRPRVFLDFMRDLVSFLKERDPESLSAIENNFDEFVNWAKAKYAA